MDPIKLDILWRRLISTVNEQATALMRSSFTSVVRDAGDLSAGVFDRRGRMVAQAVTGTPGHINTMATGMTHFLDRFPVDSLAEGDVLITNDAWFTASQLHDITVVTPIFRDGRCIAFFASCCHTQDIGGRGLSADSKSIYEEGLQIPILKVYEASRPNETLIRLIEANVRTPKEAIGDLHGQMTGNLVGGQQLLRFLDEFGLEDIEGLSDAITDRSEKAFREKIAAVPDGVYEAGLDADGFDVPLKIKARITVAGDGLSVDYAGSSGPSDMGINVCLNYTRAYTTYGLKCALAPDIPNNDGAFRPVEIAAPEGSLLNAKRPRAVCGRHLVGHFLPTAVMAALAKAGVERVMAGGFDGLWESHIDGGDNGRGEPFTYTWFSSGGTGALPGKDGNSATAFPSGVANVPVEIMEIMAPVRIHERALAPDTGGAGEYRGGLGQKLSFEILGEGHAHYAGMYERVATAAQGLKGGLPGRNGRVTVSTLNAFEPKRTYRVPAGTRVDLELPGGGGFGDPKRRDPETVRRDVLAGYVSRAEAERLYGVRLTETLEVDAPATAALRGAAAAE